MSAVPRAPAGTDPTFVGQIEQIMADIEFEPRCCNATECLANISALALFIIGCIGASGAFPGSAIGWATVGLAGGSYALMLSLGNHQERKFELIELSLFSAAFITVGALGGAGVLSATQVGWGIIGTSLAKLPLKCCVMPQIKHRLEKDESLLV